MILSVEAIVAILSLFVAIPPTILVLVTCIRSRRNSRTRQHASIHQLRALQRMQHLRTIRRLIIEIGRLFEDEARNEEDV
ncbi:hypothetical protein F5B19DRAFT_480316 [Rostrohypoxylon terebratum]|nr:hypothetical protein F5B19DRAFT_480316 [Rostrohypoxylon terebratum]